MGWIRNHSSAPTSGISSVLIYVSPFRRWDQSGSSPVMRISISRNLQQVTPKMSPSATGNRVLRSQTRALLVTQMRRSWMKQARRLNDLATAYVLKSAQILVEMYFTEDNIWASPAPISHFCPILAVSPCGEFRQSFVALFIALRQLRCA